MPTASATPNHVPVKCIIQRHLLDSTIWISMTKTVSVHLGDLTIVLIASTSAVSSTNWVIYSNKCKKLHKLPTCTRFTSSMQLHPRITKKDKTLFIRIFVRSGTQDILYGSWRSAGGIGFSQSKIITLSMAEAYLNGGVFVLVIWEDATSASLANMHRYAGFPLRCLNV